MDILFIDHISSWSSGKGGGRDVFHHIWGKILTFLSDKWLRCCMGRGHPFVLSSGDGFISAFDRVNPSEPQTSSGLPFVWRAGMKGGCLDNSPRLYLMDSWNSSMKFNFCFLAGFYWLGTLEFALKFKDFSFILTEKKKKCRKMPKRKNGLPQPTLSAYGERNLSRLFYLFRMTTSFKKRRKGEKRFDWKGKINLSMAWIALMASQGGKLSSGFLLVLFLPLWYIKWETEKQVLRGISDTTTFSLIVPLFMTWIDNFDLKKVIFVVRKHLGTDETTDRHSLLYRCIVG